MLNRHIINWLMVVAYVLLNAYGALAIKYKVNQMGGVDLDNASRYFAKLLTSPIVLIALVAIFGSAIVWISALSRMDLSVAYPAAVGLNFAVIIFNAFFLFGEAITLYKMIGIALILLSLYFLFVV